MNTITYIKRPLLNGREIMSWAFKNGFKSCLAPEDMHITLASSTTPIDIKESGINSKPFSILNWGDYSNLDPRKIDFSVTDKKRDSQRTLKRLGKKGPLVLKVPCDYIKDRWKEFIHHGGSWEYATYQPHVVLSYYNHDLDIDAIKPFSAPLHFGAEEQTMVSPNWESNIKEKFNRRNKN